jgi:hypothetical protein
MSLSPFFDISRFPFYHRLYHHPRLDSPSVSFKCSFGTDIYCAESNPWPLLPAGSPDSFRMSVGYPHLLPRLPQGDLPYLHHLYQMPPLQLLLPHGYFLLFHGDISTLLTQEFIILLTKTKLKIYTLTNDCRSVINMRVNKG